MVVVIVMNMPFVTIATMTPIVVVIAIVFVMPQMAAVIMAMALPMLFVATLAVLADHNRIWELWRRAHDRSGQLRHRQGNRWRRQLWQRR